MNDFTGRRGNNDRLKSFAKGVGRGLSALGTVMADGPKHERIKQIDTELERLQYEKDSLIAALIEPGDLKVSEGYDPTRPVIMNPTREPGDGRLTTCKGRWSASSNIHDAHPACPYLSTAHIEHQFTLRD